MDTIFGSRVRVAIQSKTNHPAFCLQQACVCFSISESRHFSDTPLYTSLLHSTYLVYKPLVTDAPRHSRWLKFATRQSCICHGSSASLSDVTGGNGRKSSKDGGSAAAAPAVADLVTFQQQLRQEMTDVIQLLSSINTALQNVPAKPAVFKPYRISDLIPRKWEGSTDKG